MPFSPFPFGTTTVADDLRQEIGGKTSLIGIYGSDIVFPDGTAFPVTLPKLAFALAWFESPDDLPERLNFLIYFPGDEDGKPTITLQLPTGDALKNVPKPSTDLGERLAAQIRPAFVLSPIVFNAPGLMKFRVQRNGEEWRAGGIRVRLDETHPPPA